MSKISYRAFRAGAAAIGVVVASAIAASPAEAVPPVVVSTGGSYTVEYPGTVCGPVTVAFDDQSVSRAHLDSAGGVTFVHFAGQNHVTITSETTGKSVSLAISGPGKFTPSTGALILTGPTLLPDQMVFVTGRTVIDIATGIVSVTGRSRDLCPELA